MQRVLGEVARLYRVGGDEFVATVVDTDEAGFRSLVERLQKAFDEVPSCEVAIGAQWTPRSSEIDRTLFDADEAMYRDKRRFYQNRSTSDVAPSRRARGDRFDERERAKARDVAQEGTLMELLGIGFARHRLDEAFTTLESNACYSLVTGDDEEGRRAVGALAKEAREAGERGFAGTVCVNRGGAPARVRVSGAFAEDEAAGGGARVLRRCRRCACVHGKGSLQALEQLTQRHAQAERDLLHEVDGGVAVARLHLGEVRPSYTRHERKLLLRQIALLAKRPDALSEEYPGCSGQKATTL